MTEITVTLTYDGCGLEFSEGTIYSIGNQMVDVIISPTEADGCGAISATINGEEPPVEVCDADTITVDVTTADGCDCTGPTTECVAETPLFMRPKFKQGKVEFVLEANPKLREAKRQKKILRMYQRMEAKRARIAAEAETKDENT